ncbi:E3 ubiquitin-protein ligase HUWE1-like isoform X2 [Tigriopus californicus]|uniref:E3 ubiquitin-protein ligase HUWE1-like isoform X2 n=1 Tax=Tigriopus californicus TaxID=6832 RepID=UPI0027D9FA8B|nr:E3 ubiquitin-protein ligase HUWE1-like isoform X2 [Tigriopus californicus]
MKIDRAKLKKSCSEVPPDCQALIERLTSAGQAGHEVFLQELQRIETWIFGKCELFHWIEVLDLCDDVLEAAAQPLHPEPRPGLPGGAWARVADTSLVIPPQPEGPAREAAKRKELLLWTLHFTTLLIEHSFSRHLYSSMEHLTALLASSDLDVILAVLNLLYMFSKRSNFITRLNAEKRQGLLNRLTYLASSWGGRENGFGLAQCCTDRPVQTFPESATTLNFEYHSEVPVPEPDSGSTGGASGSAAWRAKTEGACSTIVTTLIHVKQVDRLNQTPAEIMDDLLVKYTNVPDESRMLLFTYLRLAASFPDYQKRLKCVQARLQALSVLIYTNQLTENVQSLLYSGLLEELVEVLEMSGDHLMEIKAAALKALTSIIHLDRNPHFPKLNTIIDVTGAASYHGFLPVLVRNCITSLTANKKEAQPFPQPLATALFSFLYHLASYEAGGEALVSCGMLESLLKVIQWPSTELDHITFVTRAVRVIDLITNLDMQSFQTHSGMTCFINRLELEVEHCRKQQPYEIRLASGRRDSLAEALEQQQAEEEAARAAADDSSSPNASSGTMDIDDAKPRGSSTLVDHLPEEEAHLAEPVPGVTCLPQRSALLKSMLNFLKKAIQDPAFSDSIRHVMDGSLPNSLKHIISNAEYYGASLFLLATDVVTAYVFQEPSLLSSLQDKGLTDVVLHALLVKDVPATREVLGSLPNVFSALCLNTRGLNAFVECKPFERLFKVLLSPDYLPAMRRRRSSDPMGDTASNLGNAMDELMRHQPSLKQNATTAIIKLLEELCALGRDPKYVCSKANPKTETPAPAEVQTTTNEGGSSDEEEEEDDETSTNQPQDNTSQAEQTEQTPAPLTEKQPVPLVDYIHNVMKFVEAILSNNSTDDHCREFVKQKGLEPLMGILGLPNLPIDFPTHQACQAVAAVSKSILNLAHEPLVLHQGLLQLNEVLKKLQPLHTPLEAPGGSVLLRELVSSPVISEATVDPQATPLLHHMSAAHAYIQMFVHVCRTGQSDIRAMSIDHWGSELGLSVLRGLSKLYTSLVWESTVLLALCSEDTLPPGSEFGKADMDKLLPPMPVSSTVIAAALRTTASITTVTSGTSTTTVSASGSSAATNNPPSSSISSVEKSTENEETFSPASGTSADSNASVTAAMENLSTDPDIANMDIDGTPATHPSTCSAVGTTGEKSKDKSSSILHHQIKQIKPLLSGSSRLGRALAELFALLVKLCVGSPLRQRRGQPIPPTPATPSAPARAVASSLTKLLAAGLSWDPPSTSPIPRFRLTFFICSVGFTAPMLFDEKKYPYHLMLMKFMTSGGQKAFFDTFYWALSCSGTIPPEDGLEHPDLPDGTGEFLDSWLLLLEKMVNPKTILESPHILPSKPTPGFKPFDPIKYIARTHRLAFKAVMMLWGKKPLKLYGPRMSESVLAILCHILKGEKLIEDKLLKDSAVIPSASSKIPSLTSSGPTLRTPLMQAYNLQGGSGAAASSAASDPPANVPPAPATPAIPDPAPLPELAEPDINPEHLERLMDMGFPRERCLEAIQSTGSLDQATDYLLTNPFPPPSVPVVGLSRGGAVASGGSFSSAGPSMSGAADQDELMRAIAISLGENVLVSGGSGQIVDNSEPRAGPSTTKKAPEEEEQEDEEMDEKEFASIEKHVLDEFADNALQGCLSLIDTLPDCVFKVCDLLVAVFNRNGPLIKESHLRSLGQEVGQVLDQLNANAKNDKSFENGMDYLITSSVAAQAAARIHLFTLLYEDCKMLCAKMVHSSCVITSMTTLLDTFQKVVKGLRGGSNPVEVETPKWMTPMVLFIDLHEKVILGINRRAQLKEMCTHSWKYYDIASGKWCNYMAVNNKTIDDAFWAGETSVKIQTGRRKYTIQFGSMLQANEETGNRRPVMITIKEQTKLSKLSDSSTTNEDEDSPTPTPMDQSETPKEPSPVGVSQPENDLLKVMDGLKSPDKRTLLESCVALIGIPVDHHALNAVMRLCLRLTQDFEQAVLFSQLGGMKMLLGLTQASNFDGFPSLATLLVRHVMEDPETLRHTMEKVIRTCTVNASTPNNKELHYLFRALAPAACRAPEFFVDVAKDILRVDVTLLNKRGGELEEDPRLILKSLQPKSSSLCPNHLHEVSHSIIADLLNFLVQPDIEGDVEGPESGDTSNSATSPNADNNGGPATTSSTPAVTPSAGTVMSVANNATNRTQVIIRNSSSGDLQVPSTDQAVPNEGSASASTNKDPSKDDTAAASKAEDELKKRPLFTKSAVCKLLAELVKSYGGCAKLITEHLYECGITDLIKEETTALAFMLDELLISKSDKDLGTVVKTLVAAIASCNNQSEAQTTLVSEVKSALARALTWPESNLKHNKIQALTTLVSTMIESCPSTQSPHQNSLQAFKNQQHTMNNIVKIMLKKGVIVDLARISHNLDLSSPNVAATVNAALKPLEILTRIVNQPGNLAQRPTPGKAKMGDSAMDGQNTQNDDESGANIGTNTTNSEATRAQGDETVEPDAEATEHDISTAAESIDPNSESQLQTVEEGNDEDFDEMMDHLLEREGNHPEILAEMMTQDESHFEANTQDMSQDEEDRESENSTDEEPNSEDATEENGDIMGDDNNVAEDEEEDDEDENDDDDDDEDDDEDDEDDEDEDEGNSPFDDDDEQEDEFLDMEETIYGPPDNADHDDIDLFFHYPDGGEGPGALLDTDRANRAVHLPLWSDHMTGSGADSGGANNGSVTNHMTPAHPLLMGRQAGATNESATNRPGTRAIQRLRPAGGLRGYIQLNSRGAQGNPSAPAILQSFLGTNPQDLITQGLRRNTPLLVDFGFAILDSLENELPDMDGTGVFGNGGRAALGSIPSALVRWSDESRVIDGDSMHDCVTGLKSDIIEMIESARDQELAERRASRKKDQETEEENLQKMQKLKEAEEKARAALRESEEHCEQESSAEATGQSEGANPLASGSGNETSSSSSLMTENLVAAISRQIGSNPTREGAQSAMSNLNSLTDFLRQHETEDGESLESFGRHSQFLSELNPSVVRRAQPAQSGQANPSGNNLDGTRDRRLIIPPPLDSWGQVGQLNVPSGAEESNVSDASLPSADPAQSRIRDEESLPGALGPLSPSPDNSNLTQRTSPGERDVYMSNDTAEESSPGDNGVASLIAGIPIPPTTTSPEDSSSYDIAASSTPNVNEGTLQAPQAASDPVSQAQGETTDSQPEAGPSGTNDEADGQEDYATILGMDVSELPEGVDPSFLAALPEDMRQEVIDEQRRLQTIRQRAAQHVESTGVQEVNPEFLAALPPNIQEEVLHQQRMEQQRQAATNQNPEAPVDPGEFLQTLPTTLRRSVLADMEESQMSALPADMYTEAQNLRREYAMVHQGANSALSSILRNSFSNRGNQYVIGGFGNGRARGRSDREGWTSHIYPGVNSLHSTFPTPGIKIKGRPLLDHEGLSCLLILLFIEDSKINTTRLHRILRNLCYHAPTRDWVIHSLLNILEKSNEGKLHDQANHPAVASISFDTPPAKMRKSTSKASSSVVETSTPNSQGIASTSKTDRPTQWLNISMDAALGFRANVFQVQRFGGKKSHQPNSDKSNTVGIHPGAATFVSKHTLEVLISLAKSFPSHFLPWKDLEQGSKETNGTKKSSGASKSSSSDGKKATEPAVNDFWETLLKLDLQSTSKKGKSVVRSHSTGSSLKMEDEDSQCINFNSSPFGQLLSMLSFPVIRRSSVLTDKLLRLLSLISVGQPDVMRKSEMGKKALSPSNTTSTTETDSSPTSHEPIPADLLQLAVEVLTSKACSEEGLEDVNALLLNLSYGPDPTRDTILKLLLQGAQELGNVVRQNVLQLQNELRQLKADMTSNTEGSSESQSTLSDQSGKEKSSSRGGFVDRFTKEKVVLTAPTKVKGGSELQLPSMNTLTTKTSSQAFFLRVLKVIIQLREAALVAIKKRKAAQEAQDKAKKALAEADKADQDEKESEEKMETDQEDEQTQKPSTEESGGSEKKDVKEEDEALEEEGQGEESASISEALIESLDSLSDQLQLEPLWDALSGCLKDLADTPDHHAVLVLQASVEAFFLVHAAATQPEDKKKAPQKETRQEQLAHIQEQLEPPKGDEPGAGPSSLCPSNLSKDTEKFLEFAETHRTVLNQILRQSTNHLADGPFSVLVDHTRVLDFDIKRKYFRTELERMDENMRREDLAVHVKRENVFEDSFRELHRRTPEDWKNRFYIVFEGEEGQDAGGLLREWYVIISREIFNPMYALFKTSPGDKVTYMIYEQSQTNPNHLDYFKFVGRVIAKAIYDNKLLECYFTRSFYKHILAKPVKYTDMESEDYAFYKGLEFLIEHNVADLGYELTFSTEIRVFGVTEVKDLIPNGQNIPVTEENKREYVRLVCQMKMTSAIRLQLSAFLEGFYNIIPRRLISIFNEQELELLLSGLPNVDVDDLKANTEYHKYQANSLQIVWFWRALRSFDQTDKAKFMQFVTGSSKVPLQGFGALEGMNGPQKFQIHRDDRSTDRLPSAHTCFNQLDLPAYETYDKLRTYLLKAVQECSEGFGFA